MFRQLKWKKLFAEHMGSYDFVARAQMVYEVDKMLYTNKSEVGQKIEVFSNSFWARFLSLKMKYDN